jgi:hypothetical protein
MNFLLWGSLFEESSWWSSPAMLLSGASSAELMAKFYCIKFEISPVWKARNPYSSPPGTRIAQLYFQAKFRLYSFISSRNKVWKVKVKVNLTSDGQSASLSLNQTTTWDQGPIFLSLQRNYLQIFSVFLSKSRPLWREDGSAIYSYKCYLVLPALSLSPLKTRGAMVEAFEHTSKQRDN